MTPEERSQHESLLGQVRGLTAKASRLEAEILEARNEAATVRRAYLHERSRAERAIGYLRSAADGIEAAAYVEHDARKP